MKYFFAIASLFYSIVSFGQNITGNWEGSLQLQGTEIPIVFHIKKDSTGKYVASFDSPKQKAYNMACSDVFLKEDSVILMMQILKGKYAGKLENKNQLTGMWSQGEMSFPLIMKKTSDVVTTKELNRPQIPKPPFPYRSEDVEYDNADKSIHFGATFTVPLPDPHVNYFKAPVYPTVLLITGSGKQDRDETILGHKSFAVIADYLTKQGIAVLRVDDRGTGKTTGNYETSTSADFAKDVQAGIEYLKSRPEVDITNLGIIGHSEGGMIAPIVAAKSKDVNFVVLLAGPGIQGDKILLLQNELISRASGIVEDDIKKALVENRKLYDIIIASTDNQKLKTDLTILLNEKLKDTKADEIPNGMSKNDYIAMQVNYVASPWMQYFIKYNPALTLEKVKCPVLAINGGKDLQVPPKENLAAIESALKKGGNTHVTIREFPNLNHLFQECKSGAPSEYAEIEQTFSPLALDQITKWIQNQTK